MAGIRKKATQRKCGKYREKKVPRYYLGENHDKVIRKRQISKEKQQEKGAANREHRQIEIL